MYWDAAIETLSPSELRELQLSRLKETLARAARSPFYRERLAEAGVTPENLRSTLIGHSGGEVGVGEGLGDGLAGKSSPISAVAVATTLASPRAVAPGSVSLSRTHKPTPANSRTTAPRTIHRHAGRDLRSCPAGFSDPLPRKAGRAGCISSR